MIAPSSRFDLKPFFRPLFACIILMGCATAAVEGDVARTSLHAAPLVADTDVSNAYAYPVPFRPGRGDVGITFSLLPSAGTIRIYDAAGELVRNISFADSFRNDGKVVWDGTNQDGQPVGSDVYLYIVQSGDNKKTGKLVVIR